MLLIFNHAAVHVKSTGEIGKIKISKIENKGKQNRRINLTWIIDIEQLRYI